MHIVITHFPAHFIMLLIHWLTTLCHAHRSDAVLVGMGQRSLCETRKLLYIVLDDT